MNTYFNFRRMILVMKKFRIENQNAFCLLLLTLVALLVIWLGIYLCFRNGKLFSEQFQIGYYFIGLFLSGCLSANFLFADLGSKSKAINFLLQPSSSLEKMLCALFFGVFIFWIGYTAAFYLVDALFVFLANNIYGTYNKVINIFMLDQYNDPFFDRSPNNLFFLYFSFQSLYIAGSLFFSRYSFFKTVIITVVIFVALILLPGFVHIFLPPGNFQQSLTAFEVLDYRGNKVVEMPLWFSTLVAIFLFYVITPWLWFFSYLRLREKEVS